MTLAFELSKHNKKCVYKAMYKKKKKKNQKQKTSTFDRKCCILEEILLASSKKKKKRLSVAYSIFPIATQNAYLG